MVKAQTGDILWQVFYMLVKFSPEKRKSITISWNKTRLDILHQLQEVDHLNHLGITLQNDLLWEKHIDNILNSANKKLNILFALKYKLDCKTLDIMYFSFVRPLLE